MLYLAFLLFFLLFSGIIFYSWYRLQKEVSIHASGGSDTPEKYHLPFKIVSFITEDGATLAGWYIPVDRPKAVVIVVHGRGVVQGGKSSMLDHALYLYENGYSTFLFDMRSFGESKGSHVGFGEKEWRDVVAAYTYVAQQEENKKTKIGFLGFSMGATSVLIAAGKEGIGDFVIASVPFASHMSLFSKQVAKENIFPKQLFVAGLLLASFFALGMDYFRYEAIRFINKIKSPLLLIAAKKDNILHFTDVWKLYEKANKPKEYWEASTGHDVAKEAKEEFRDKVLRFLQIYAI